MNKKPLDFTLENEKFLGEVVNGVETWLKNSNLIITSMKIGSRELLEEDAAKWGKTPVTDIDTLSMTVKPADEIHLSAMENIRHFLCMLKKSIAKNDNRLFSELLQGYPYMEESLTLILSSHPDKSSPSITSFIELFSGLGDEHFPSWSTAQKEDALAVVSTILSEIEAFIIEIRNPLEALHDVTEALKCSIEEISEVSILLQTGKDRKAMDVLIAFSTVFQNFVRVLLLVKNRNIMSFDTMKIAGTGLEEYYNELNAFLRELSDAIAINDSVLIGDLLEYEIAPRLAELIRFIEIIEESDTVKNGKSPHS
ncbi:MAG: hypothetical protein JW881_20360 [Spirochaetales bacterium]|nr:hypothetical protein [Spirochaetales bacterium]